MLKAIEKAIARSDKARGDLKRVILRECLGCAHSHIAECGAMSPEWRICLDCGLTEEGWGCGYEVLIASRERVGTIGYNKTIRLRTASLWQANHGEPLAERLSKFLGLPSPAAEDQVIAAKPDPANK
jgi:hypothetical protein